MGKEKQESFTTMNNIPITSSIRGIEYITLAGGGRKGSAYISAVEEIENSGVLRQIKEIAGSSAGGLMATALAVGSTAKQIQEFMNLDFRTLQDKAELGWVEATHIQDLLEGVAAFGGYIDKKIDKIKGLPVVGNLVKSYSGTMQDAAWYAQTGITVFSALEKAETIGNVVLGSGLGVWEGDALTNLLSKMITEQGLDPSITFKELADLAEIPGSPFKKLTLTGTNLTKGKLQYFNAEETPDMPILLAARISASYPGGYKPVIVDGEVWVDGGLLENLPDVFNKEPYIAKDGKNEHGGNKKALALTLVSPEERKIREKGREIAKGKNLLSALVDTKTSEEPLYAKYGSTLVEVDTTGVGTLEFKLSKEREEKLLASGGKAIQTTFEKILEEENVEKDVNYYENLSDAELTRIATELKKMGLEKTNADYPDFKQELDRRKRISEENRLKLQRLEKEAELNFERKQELKDFNKEELFNEKLPQLGIDKIENKRKYQKEKLEEFKLIKVALEFEKDEILKEFDEDKLGLRDELTNLNKQNEFIRDKIRKRASEEVLQGLEVKRQELYNDLIERFKNEKTFLANFFQDLKEDSGKPAFKVPTDRIALERYCSEDIKVCTHLIGDIEEEINRLDKQIPTFVHQLEVAKVSKSRTARLNALQELNTNLNNSILRNTTIITKMNNFIVEKAPKLRRVVAPFLNAVSFLAFISSFPAGIPAYVIAKGVEKFSKNDQSKQTARKVIDFFKKSDIDRDMKLRELKAITTQCVKTMRDNYTMDNEESSHLHELHAQYLARTGIDLESIFVKEPSESQAAYKKRIEVQKAKFGIESLTKGGKNLEAFVKEVQQEVVELQEKEIKEHAEYIRTSNLKLKHGDSLKYDEMQKYITSAKAIDREVPKGIYLKFLNETDLSIRNKKKLNKALTPEIIGLYIESTEATGKKFTRAFLENSEVKSYIRSEECRKKGLPKALHLQLLNELDTKMKGKKANKLDEQEIRWYLESSNVIARKLPKIFFDHNYEILDKIEQKDPAIKRMVERLKLSTLYEHMGTIQKVQKGKEEKVKGVKEEAKEEKVVPDFTKEASKKELTFMETRKKEYGGSKFGKIRREIKKEHKGNEHKPKSPRK